MKNSLDEKVLSEPSRYMTATQTGLMDADMIPIVIQQHYSLTCPLLRAISLKTFMKPKRTNRYHTPLLFDERKCSNRIEQSSKSCIGDLR